MAKVKIAKILGFGGVCPTQLEAITDDNRIVYGRYRFGNLTIQAGQPEELDEMAGIRGEYIFCAQIGDEYAGSMELSEMAELTKEVIEWPENISVDDGEQIDYILP